MTLSRLAAHLSRVAVLARDANAVKRGRVPQRAVNRTAAKLVARQLRGIWR